MIRARDAMFHKKNISMFKNSIIYVNVRNEFFKIFHWMDCSDIEKLLDSMYDDVKNDIIECADPEEWNLEDVRIAIRRTMFKRMDID